MHDHLMGEDDRIDNMHDYMHFKSPRINLKFAVYAY